MVSFTLIDSDQLKYKTYETIYNINVRINFNILVLVTKFLTNATLK